MDTKAETTAIRIRLQIKGLRKKKAVSKSWQKQCSSSFPEIPIP